VIIPINIGNSHWTLAVIYVARKVVAYYDSMGGTGRYYLKCIKMYLKVTYPPVWPHQPPSHRRLIDLTATTRSVRPRGSACRLS